VLQGLKNEKQHLEVEIDTLKKENAKLHKQYLEWMDAQ
jgi:FtsZ-binding cell division protein ZapB